MKYNNEWNDFEVLSTGGGEKLERWGDVYLLRPDPQVIWESETNLGKFAKLNARYHRSSEGGGGWKIMRPFKEEWTVGWRNLKFLIKPMGFKHTGLFPEQAVNWATMIDLIKNANRPINVLNLFGYTGGATVACASAGASVCHVDAAKNMVERCKQNIELSGLKDASVRYIVDDCRKFVEREIKRGKRYDAIIMDPPSYGRGTNGEVWKLEDNLFEFVKLVSKVLSDNPLFVLINSYTTGLGGQVMENCLRLAIDKNAECESYEVCLPCKDGLFLPCGNSAIMTFKKAKMLQKTQNRGLLT